MRLENYDFAILFATNILLAFYILPWTIFKKNKILTSVFCILAFFIEMYVLYSEDAVLFAIMGSVIMVSICFLAGMSMAKRKLKKLDQHKQYK